MTIVNYTNYEEAIELHENLQRPITFFTEPLLTQFNITWFGYVRLFPDGSRFIINNKKDWLREYLVNDFQNDYQQTMNLDINHQASGKITYYSLWSCLKNTKVFDFFYENNIYNGVYVYRKRKEGSEVFSFATSRNNVSANDFYMNNIEFLNYFIYRFKDKFSSVINNIKQSTIIPTTATLNHCKIKDSLFNTFIQDQLSLFYEKTEIKRLYFNFQSNVYATKQECLCLNLLSNGLTEKETAVVLNLSVRTVESYLNNLKKKLNCKYKSHLLEIYSHGFQV